MQILKNNVCHTSLQALAVAVDLGITGTVSPADGKLAVLGVWGPIYDYPR